MPTYGPHNLRWTAGPQGADILGMINPGVLAEEYPIDLFGTILDELPKKTGDQRDVLRNLNYLSNMYRPEMNIASNVGDWLAKKLNTIVDPMIDTDFINRYHGHAPAQPVKDFGIKTLAYLQDMAEKLKNSPNHAEFDIILNKLLPSFMRGERESNK